MEDLFVSFLVGVFKGIPAVALGLLSALGLVRLWKRLRVGKLWAWAALLFTSACGFAAAWALSLATLTPYDGKLHPVATLIIISLIFSECIDFYRIQARKTGEMSGSSTVNKLCVVAGSVAALIMFGLYAPGAGTAAHEALTVAIFISALWASQWLIFFRPAIAGLEENGRLERVAFEIVEFALLIGALWYYYEVLHGWEFFVF